MDYDLTKEYGYLEGKESAATHILGSIYFADFNTAGKIENMTIEEYVEQLHNLLDRLADNYGVSNEFKYNLYGKEKYYE